MEPVKVFVLGYTGEIGKVLLQELARDKVFKVLLLWGDLTLYMNLKSVVLIGRRKVDLPEELDSRFVQETIDFEKLDEHKDAFKDCTVGFCCLGTTKGKSGAKGFVKVDYDYVAGSAEVAKAAGCQHFHLVSSKGADKNSMLLYPKTKGEIEEKVTQMGFPRLSIYRPAVLLCDRVESRPMEKVFRFLLKPVAMLSPTMATVPVETVARAMIKRTKEALPDVGVEILDNVKIHGLGKEEKP